jgi:hypothetical protein
MAALNDPAKAATHTSPKDGTEASFAHHVQAAYDRRPLRPFRRLIDDLASVQFRSWGDVGRDVSALSTRPHPLELNRNLFRIQPDN